MKDKKDKSTVLQSTNAAKQSILSAPGLQQWGPRSLASTLFTGDGHKQVQRAEVGSLLFFVAYPGPECTTSFATRVAPCGVRLAGLW